MVQWMLTSTELMNTYLGILKGKGINGFSPFNMNYIISYLHFGFRVHLKLESDVVLILNWNLIFLFPLDQLSTYQVGARYD